MPVEPESSPAGDAPYRYLDPPRALGPIERLAWVPVPVLVITVAVLYNTGLRLPHDSPFLLTHLNFIFLILTSVFVAHRSGRAFLAVGDPMLLMLNCAALLLGLGTTVATVSDWLAFAPTRAFPAWCVWLAALCHLAAALLRWRPIQPLRARPWWLGLAYTLGLGFGAVVAVFPERGGASALQGLTGSAVLGTGIGAYLFASMAHFASNRQSRSVFGHYYALALLLFPIGLLVHLLGPAQGESLAWAGRSAQFLGGAYLALALQEHRLEPSTPRAFTMPLPRQIDHLWPWLAVLLVGVATAFRAAFLRDLGAEHVFLTFYPAVMLAALLGGLRAGLLATLLSGIAVDWFWITPWEVGGGDLYQRFELMVFLLSNTTLSFLAEAIRRAKARAGAAEIRAQVAAEKVLAAQVLREQEARFRLLAEASFEGIAITEAGRFVEVNDQYCRILGYAKTELLGMDLAATLPPEDQDEFLPMLTSGEGQLFEHRLVRKDGSTVSVEAQVRPFFIEGRSCRMAAVRDLTARREAQGILARYQLLAQYARDPLLLMDVGGRIVLVNQAAVEFYGYPREDFQGMDIHALRADRAPVVDHQMGQARTGGILFETEHRLREGNLVPVEVSSRGIVLEGREMVLSVIRDISRRKQAEGDLVKSNATMKAILDTANESIWLADPEGRLLLANPTAAQRLGIPLNDMVGRRMDAFRPSEVGPARLSRLLEVVATATPTDFEDEGGGLRFHHSMLPIRGAQGKVTAVAGFTRDITQARRAEEALRQSHRRLEVLSAAVAALLHGDNPQNLIGGLARQVMATLQCQLFVTFLTDPATGSLVLYACGGIRPEDAARLATMDTAMPFCEAEACQACAFVGDHVEPFLAPPPILSEQYGILAYACRPLLTSDGQVAGTLAFGATSRDRFSREDLALMAAVTNHIAIALENQRSKARLRLYSVELEQKVAERTAEVNTLVHQLRALAAERLQTEQRERKRLALLLHDHLQQLLVAAQIRVGLLSETKGRPPRDRYEAVLSILRDAIAASRSLAVELSPPILHQGGLGVALAWHAKRVSELYGFTVHLKAAPIQEPGESVKMLLFESARELLLNATKHSGAKEATVTLEDGDDGWLRLVVADPGQGFNPASLAPGEGGFGLFSIQQRLAHFGGRLDVESAPGSGTRLTLLVPHGSAAAPEAQAGSAPAPHQAVPGQPRGMGPSIGVLLVEDNPIMRQSLTEMLALETDLRLVGSAQDGLDGLDLARQLHPDVVVTDVTMPRMGGVEFTRALREELPGIKVIGLSLHHEEEVAAAMREAGAVAYLTKGGPFGDLLQTIRAAGAVEA
jgi:PAS domain S-box-containing protein